MTKLSLTKPETGKLNTVEEPKVATAFTAIETVVNGELEGTNNIKAEGVTEANLTAAVQTLLNAKSFAAMTVNVKSAAAVTAASGELVIMQKDASVLTLPEPTANRIVGAVCSSPAVTIKVAPAKAATKVYGGFVELASNLTLTTWQIVVLEGDGTNWAIISGEPKREQTYGAETTSVKGVAEAGVEPSATRPAYVVLSTAGVVEVGGVKVASPGATGSTGYYIPPGVKWKSNAITVSSTLLL